MTNLAERSHGACRNGSCKRSDWQIWSIWQNKATCDQIDLENCGRSCFLSRSSFIPRDIGSRASFRGAAPERYELCAAAVRDRATRDKSDVLP